MHRWRRALRAHSLPVTLRGGVPIHALRMMSIYPCILGSYRYIPWYTELSFFFVQKHVHIENIKTVANLNNNKDVFVCILHFHARAGYLQTYETLLDQLRSHPDSDQVLQDQYHDDVETQWHTPSLTAISMSTANRESAILHLLPCWTVEKWCGNQLWLYTMFKLLYTFAWDVYTVKPPL